MKFAALSVPALSRTRAGALLLLVLLRCAVGAAEPRVARPTVLHVALPKAIQMAIAKNFEIQVERFQPQIARAEVTRELGRFDPRLDLSYERSEQTTRDIFGYYPPDGRQRGNSLPAEAFTAQRHFSTSRYGATQITQTERFGLGTSGLTPWGLDYNISLGTSPVGSTENRFRDLWQSDLRLNVTQPLLQGFGTDTNLASLRIARNNALVSEWQLRQRVIDIITEAVFVYNELHLAHENLRVATGFRDLARQLLEDNTKRADIGVMSPLNITTARAEAASREEAVILSRRSVKDNENLLKQLITNDIQRILDVAIQIEPPPFTPFRPDVPGGINDALAVRPDYRQAMIEIENRRITIAVRNDEALPRFDLQGSLRLLGFDNDFGTSVSRVPKRDQTDWTIGAIFSVPIPNRAGRGSVAAAKLSSAQALVNLQRLEQQIVVDVDNASGQIVTSRQRIESTGVARQLAAESHEAGQERLRAGTGTTFEALELQRKLAEAEFAELRARADYNKAVSEYHRQTGTSLRVHRVTID